MDSPAEAKLLKFLLKNPDGVQKERIMNHCGYETNSAFSCALRRVKKKHPEYEFPYDSIEKTYMVREVNVIEKDVTPHSGTEGNTMENDSIPVYIQNGQTKTEGLIDLLEEYPEGLTKQEIKETMGLESDQHVYTVVNYARNKNGFNIVLINDRYKLQGSKGVKRQQSKAGLTTPSTSSRSDNGFQLPLETANRLQRMSPSDARDAIDMLKKSYFYKQSAEALMNASEAAVSLTSTLLS
jgi:hypothetical protein